MWPTFKVRYRVLKLIPVVGLFPTPQLAAGPRRRLATLATEPLRTTMAEPAVPQVIPISLATLERTKAELLTIVMSPFLALVFWVVPKLRRLETEVFTYRAELRVPSGGIVFRAQ